MFALLAFSGIKKVGIERPLAVVALDTYTYVPRALSSDGREVGGGGGVGAPLRYARAVTENRASQTAEGCIGAAAAATTTQPREGRLVFRAGGALARGQGFPS